MDVLDKCPDIGYSYRDTMPVAVLAFAGPEETTRVRLSPRSIRNYEWKVADKDSERLWYDNFFRDLRLPVFLVKDPKDFQQTGAALELVSGALYKVPSMNRHYPIGPLVAYVNGLPVGVASIDTDARTVTLDQVATGTVTADFVGLRLCRLADHFTWSVLSQSWFSTSIPIQEVLA